MGRIIYFFYEVNPVFLTFTLQCFEVFKTIGLNCITPVWKLLVVLFFWAGLTSFQQTDAWRVGENQLNEKMKAGWWQLKIFFMFIPIWGNDPV